MTENIRIEPEAPSDVTGSWTLDPRRTTVHIRTKALWVVKVDGTLRATEGSGLVDSNGQVTGRLVVDTNSIDTKNEKRDAHLRNADFFDVQKYPTFVFEVAGARLHAAGQCTIKGYLTIRGVTRPVEFSAALRMEGDESITIDAQAEIDRSKWGMGWAKMGAGLDNRVTVKATFVRREVA
ncbi:polyisoprenoid-binding protein YceI [Streptomyces aurantiacus]|uniref:YceI family protein n=1 Tax=Streptomyces aurantiacus TaxID=47760 RepID=UPI00278E5A63|nr:YceI family protein [Streptomyces aurantiacus]MDQ0774215.1 polyisoprenoid-binding protein YceI [Streptomyces aurantiacus]